MAASEVTGHFFIGPIVKNILKGVLLQQVKFHAFIIKWTIPSYITTSQPNYISHVYFPLAIPASPICTESSAQCWPKVWEDGTTLTHTSGNEAVCSGATLALKTRLLWGPSCIPENTKHWFEIVYYVGTTLVWYLYNAGRTSSTLVQHCKIVIQMFCVCWDRSSIQV